MKKFKKCCEKFPELKAIERQIIEEAQHLVPPEINPRWYGNGKFKDYGFKSQMVEIMDQQPEYSMVYAYLYDLLNDEVEKANQKERKICYFCAAFVQKGYNPTEYDGQCRRRSPSCGDEPWPTVGYRDFCMEFVSAIEEGNDAKLFSINE